MRISILRLFLVLAAASLALSSGLEASEWTKIRIGYPIAMNGRIPIVMQRAGIDRKHGLVGEFTAFQYGPPMFEALASGNLDAIVTSLYPAIAYASRLPGDFRVVAALGHSIYALMVPRDSAIGGWDDLKGKKIAISFNATPHLDMLRTLGAKGLKATDTSLLNFPPAELPLAFEKRFADAVVVFQPTVARLREDFDARVVHSWPFHFLTGVRGKYLTDNPAVAERYIAALSETARFIDDNRDETNRWFAEALRLDPRLVTLAVQEDEAQSAMALDATGIGLSPQFKQLVADWANTAYESGMIKTRVDVTGMFP